MWRTSFLVIHVNLSCGDVWLVHMYFEVSEGWNNHFSMPCRIAYHTSSSPLYTFPELDDAHRAIQGNNTKTRKFNQALAYLFEWPSLLENLPPCWPLLEHGRRTSHACMICPLIWSSQGLNLQGLFGLLCVHPIKHAVSPSITNGLRLEIYIASFLQFHQHSL